MQYKRPISPIRKRAFLLFELLLSLALVALCLIPLLKPAYVSRRLDKKEICELQLQNAAHSAFCSIKRQLAETRDIGPLLQTTTETSLGMMTLYTKERQSQDVECKYELSCVARCDKKDGRKACVVSLNIFFPPLVLRQDAFSHTLYVELHPHV